MQLGIECVKYMSSHDSVSVDLGNLRLISDEIYMSCY